MTYIQCLVYDPEGNFRGYSILNHEASKLKSTNLWSEDESADLAEQLSRLNDDFTLKAHWPRGDDPEVLALLNDPNFMPLETEIRDIVDDDNSYYVWKKMKNVNGEWVDGDELDEDASVIVYKKAEVPVRPVEAQLRTKKAHETVARKRANLSPQDA